MQDLSEVATQVVGVRRRRVHRIRRRAIAGETLEVLFSPERIDEATALMTVRIDGHGLLVAICVGTRGSTGDANRVRCGLG